MTSQLKTILFDKKFALGIFLLVHIILFNINTAEWGDSYRILRASQFVRKGAYPTDEKRPPLFPALLAARPAAIDPVMWARGFMLVISVFYFLVFSSLAEKIIKDKRFLLLSKLLFIFNPVILYWSLRVMSDIPFAFLCLLGFYIIYTSPKKLDLGIPILLGFITGASVLMRFEGYLLFVSLLFGIVFNGFVLAGKNLKIERILSFLKTNIYSALIFTITFVLVILPYIILRNPFDSSYFGETASRSYDLKMVWVYLISLLCLFGFVPAVFFATNKFAEFIDFFAKNISMLVFVVLELALILVWPAAIPRIFAGVIPVLIIPLTLSLKEFLSEWKFKRRNFVVTNLIILAVFIFSQYFLKLQFLVPQKYWFIGLVLIQLLLIISIYLRKKSYFYIFLVSGLIVWCFSPIVLHKDNFISVKKAAEYAEFNLKGVVAYNDISSVSDWYLNDRVSGDDVVGFYYNTDKKSNLTLNELLSKKIDYLLITNEHNTTMTLDLSKRPYLEEMKDFRYNIGGKEFFAKVLKVNKERNL